MVQVHTKYITIQAVAPKISLLKCHKLRYHLANLLSLASLTWIQEYVSLGYECGLFKPGAMELIEEATKLLLSRLRPQAIPLIENLSHQSDNVLMSAIGNSYGDIYET